MRRRTISTSLWRKSAVTKCSSKNGLAAKDDDFPLFGERPGRPQDVFKLRAGHGGNSGRESSVRAARVRRRRDCSGVSARRCLSPARATGTNPGNRPMFGIRVDPARDNTGERKTARIDLLM